MKRTSKHLLCLLLALAMVFSLAAPAFAEEADPETETVGFLRYDEDAKLFVEDSAACAVIDADSTALSAGWYVVNSEVTVADRIQISGEVNLILADDAKLTAEQGISVAKGNTLNIFAQSGGTGELIATGKDNNSGIGGNATNEYGGKKAGTVTIHGGTVTATGSVNGAGIGGNYYLSDGSITIYGGTVIANGGDGGAGIGGNNSGYGCSITINGGTVTATGGGDYSVGIGGEGFTITINDGMVTANGGDHDAGISGGSSSSGGSITINGGTVIANGGDSGAGIGVGFYHDGGSITINGGNVTANGGNYGAGIGGGSRSPGGSITINGGTVIANGGEQAAGVGGGREGNDGGNITINGGDVTANGGEYGGAGIGGGRICACGVVMINGGNVTANGSEEGAGIGGGNHGDGGVVTITGGNVTAIGGINGAGIGGDPGFEQGTLTVAEGLIVRGGANADSLAVLEAPYDTRPAYMTVKPVPKVSFVWSWDGDTPAVTLKLAWPDGETKEVPMEVTVSEAEGVIIYAATATVDGTAYTSEKTVERTYSVTVENGSITSGQKESYSYGDQIIVTAGPAPEGMAFAGWYLGDELVSTAEVYGRCVDRDFTLEARYDVQPVEVQPTVTASDTARVLLSGGKYKTTLSVSWSVPEGYSLVEAGLIRAYAKSQPSQATLLTKGTKKASTLTNANGVYNLTVNMAAGKKDYGLYYVGYLTYNTAGGETVTVYTEIGCNQPIS